MTSTTEGPSGARRFARLGETPDLPVSTGGDPETLSLNRIGEFLELDFGRLFVWLR